MSLRLAVVRVLRDLNDLGIGHAVIGGLAVSARVEPRMTRDVDIAIAAIDDRAAEDVVHRLLGMGLPVPKTSLRPASPSGRLLSAVSGVVATL